MLRPWLLLPIVALSLPSARAQDLYSPPTLFATGSEPRGHTAVDLNADGDVDLAVACRGSDEVWIHHGNGSGGLLDLPLSIAVPMEPVHVDASDFDADGDLDLVCVSFGAAQVSILLNLGSAGFAHAPGSPFSLPPGNQPQFVDCADLDGDGAEDLVVVVAFVGGGVFAYLGDGTGQFSLVPGAPFSTGGDSRHASLGDVDCDGLLDVVTANHNDQSVSILSGMGGGSLGMPVTISVGSYVQHVSAADLDLDGDLDIVAAMPGSSPIDNRVAILENQGCATLTFQAWPGSPFVVGSGPVALIVDFLDCDAAPDIATANYFSHDVTVLLGAAFAQSAPGSPFTTSDVLGGVTQPAWISSADWNGDCRPDLIVSNSATGKLGILTNQQDPPPQVYCTAKVNSKFCIPRIGYEGWPCLDPPGEFEITAVDVISNKNGLFFYGTTNGQAFPFQGGLLCVQAPITRTSLQFSGGNPPPEDCSGTYGFNFLGWVSGGQDPALIAGSQVWGQYWYRDPLDFSGFGSGLTDALTFTLCQ